MRSEVTWPTIPAMVRDAARRFGDAEAVVDGDRRVDLRRALGDRSTDAARALLAVGHRARRPGRGLGAELARVDRRRARRHDRGRRARPGEHAVQGRRGRVRPRAQRRARAVHRARVPRHRLPGAARRRRRRAARRSSTRSCSSGDADGGAIGWDDFLARGDAVPDADVDARVASIGPDDPSDVVFTSGTTGSPKGVVMTHGQTLRAYLDWCDWADLRAGDRYLIANPFFHIFGYKAGCLASPDARRDDLPARGVRRRRRARDRRARADHRAPGAADDLPVAARPSRPRRAATSRACALAVTGAADIPVELIRRVREELPFERILTGYGLTEAGTVTGSQPDDDFEHIATTVGVPWAGLRGAHRRPSRAPTPRRASRARSWCAARP